MAMYHTEKYFGLETGDCLLRRHLSSTARVIEGLIILTMKEVRQGAILVPVHASCCYSLTDIAWSTVLYECPLDTSICVRHQQDTKRRVLTVFHQDNIDLLMSEVVTVYLNPKIHTYRRFTLDTSANIRPQNKATLLTTLASVGCDTHSHSLGNLKCDRHGGWAHLHACALVRHRVGLE